MKELPIDWMEDLGRHLLTTGVALYKDQFEPEHEVNREASIAAMIFVARPFPENTLVPEEFAAENVDDKAPVMVMPVPSDITRRIMDDRSRAKLRQLVRQALTENDLPWPVGGKGPAAAVYLLTETWMARETEKEDFERYDTLADHPDASSGIMITMYSNESTRIFTQRVAGGNEVGEVIENMLSSKASGNLVLNTADLH